jgi:hypothetical protein
VLNAGRPVLRDRAHNRNENNYPSSEEEEVRRVVGSLDSSGKAAVGGLEDLEVACEPWARISLNAGAQTSQMRQPTQNYRTSHPVTS